MFMKEFSSINEFVNYKHYCKICNKELEYFSDLEDEGILVKLCCKYIYNEEGVCFSETELNFYKVGTNSKIQLVSEDYRFKFDNNIYFIDFFDEDKICTIFIKILDKLQEINVKYDYIDLNRLSDRNYIKNKIEKIIVLK
jgi:hypothetical protein